MKGGIGGEISLGRCPWSVPSSEHQIPPPPYTRLQQRSRVPVEARRDQLQSHLPAHPGLLHGAQHLEAAAAGPGAGEEVEAKQHHSLGWRTSLNPHVSPFLTLCGCGCIKSTLFSPQAPHWDTAVALHYSRTGSHFVGLGEGGLVAVWRQDRVGVAGVGYADWTHHVSVRL